MDTNNPAAAYLRAKKELGEYFGTDIWYNVIDQTNEKWTDHGDWHSTISWEWAPPDELGEGFWMCSGKIYGTSRWTSVDELYTLIIANDGCGNRDCYMFKNSMKEMTNDK